VSNQHSPVSGGCQEQVAYANNTRPFLGAGAYTASNNSLHLKSGLATQDYTQTLWTKAISRNQLRAGTHLV